VPPVFRGGVVSHNDPNLDNVVFSGGRAVALIDFDLAGPGSAVWDVACAARLWAPLRDERDTPARPRGGSLARLRAFVDAYGLARRERSRVVDAAIESHDWCSDIARQAVTDGHQTFEGVWRDGGEQRAERTRRWIAAHREHMRAALGAE
jgi:thiamine kinase-like enzyme